ncbi:MAG: PaaI family thioesterase [Sandarakinorhabdus sp.]|nr:PaaI family thioesterase [Sandarakinorhabdus sp.]
MSDDIGPQLTPAERQQRFVQRFLAGVPHLSAVGIVYRAHGPDWAELEMPFAQQQLADPDYGIIASGAIFTLMDNSAGFSVHMALGEFLPIATIDLRLDYLRGPAPGATVVGRATCYRLTRQIAFVRGVAHDGDPDRPIANMAGTFIIPPRAAAAA